MKNKELQEYIQTQITQAPKRLKGLTNDMQGKPLFKRSVFLVLQKYVNDFLKKGTADSSTDHLPKKQRPGS